MRIFFILLLFIGFFTEIQSQDLNDFEILLEVKSTPLKDQQSSGTCWSFATTSFIETEALRLGKDTVNLSPMFYVKPTYLNKAEKYIETEGASWFDAGDLTFSVLAGYNDFGAMPEEVYNGVTDHDWQHDHLEMDNLLFAMAESIGTSGYGRIKPFSWKLAFESTLNAYLGDPPAVFYYQGDLYSPQSFAREHVGIKPEEYVEITSYTHSEFYKMFVLNIPANWNKNEYLNIPISDLENLVDYALENGYSLAWDGDVSEPNFDFESGVLKLTESEERLGVTQELRQKSFEDKTTTDDHNMHIIGKAKNKEGEVFYMMKNSEGDNEMNGYIFMSKNALLLKTISLLVHEDGIQSEVVNKL